MIVLSVYFLACFLVLSLVKSVIVEHECSLLGLKLPSEDQLVQIIRSLVPSDEFLTLIRARYFDYSPQVRLICAESDDREFVEQIAAKLSSEFPELAADCLAVASINFPELNFQLANPLRSKLFGATQLPVEVYFQLLQSAKTEPNIHTRWGGALKDSRLSRKGDEYLQPLRWNELPWQLWTTISFLTVEKVAVGVRQQILDIVNYEFKWDIVENRGEFISRLLLVGFAYQRALPRDFDSIFTAVEAGPDSLLQNLSKCIRFGGAVEPCEDLWFFEALLQEILAFTPSFAPILNLVHFASNWIKSSSLWTEVVNKVGIALYGSQKQWPTILETVELISICKKHQQSVWILLLEFISQQPSYMRFVMQEGGQIIPESLKPTLLPLQSRAEIFLRRHRCVNCNAGTFLMAVNEDEDDEMLSFLQICNQILGLKGLGRRLIHLRARLSVLGDSGILESNTFYNFPIVINKFFALFMKHKEWYLSSETSDGIIPRSTLHPQFLFVFGLFLGAALVWQQSLPFKLSLDYFSLLNSPSLTVLKAFIIDHFGPSGEDDTVLVAPPPLASLREVITASLYENLEFGVLDLDSQARAFGVGLERLRAGLEAACDISLFTLLELHTLLFISAKPSKA